MKKKRISELSSYISWQCREQEYSTVVVDCTDLTYVVDFRDLDTVAGEDSTAVDKSADSPSIADVDSVYSNTVVIG